MTAINATLEALSDQTAVDAQARVAELAAFISSQATRLVAAGGDVAEAHSALEQIARAACEGLRAMNPREPAESSLAGDRFSAPQTELLRWLVRAYDDGVVMVTNDDLATFEADLEWLRSHGWARQVEGGWLATRAGVRLVHSVD